MQIRGVPFGRMMSPAAASTDAQSARFNVPSHHAKFSGQSRKLASMAGLKFVFLSYASEDAGAAARIAGALRSAGVEVWFDRSEFRGGDVWNQSIQQQIRDCCLFVPIISRSTEARGEGCFRLEWKLAVDRSHTMAADQRFFVPVVIDATAAQAAIAAMTDEQLKDPTNGAVRLTLAAAQARLGKVELARETLEQFWRAVPQARTIADMQRWMYPTADLYGFEPLFDGLKQAGVA